MLLALIMLIWCICRLVMCQPQALLSVFKVKPGPYLFYKNRRKPRWVIKTIFELKALNPDLASRQLAAAFNRQFGHGDTVSHSTV